jgi:hypothetical protein
LIDLWARRNPPKVVVTKMADYDVPEICIYRGSKPKPQKFWKAHYFNMLAHIPDQTYPVGLKPPFILLYKQPNWLVHFASNFPIISCSGTLFFLYWPLAKGVHHRFILIR